MHLKILSAEVVCCKYFLTLLSNVNIEANSIGPDKTAPESDLDIHCLLKRPLKHFSI